MAVGLHQLQPAVGSRSHDKRVGRGNASGHGTYSTRGQKGQRARSGGRGGLKIKGIKLMIRNLPKYKGFKSLKDKPEIVNLTLLEKNFNNGGQVSPLTLYRAKLIDHPSSAVKILADGVLTKKLTVMDCQVSAKARQLIEQAGGKV